MMNRPNAETPKPIWTSSAAAVPSTEAVLLAGAAPLGGSAARIFASAIGPRIALAPEGEGGGDGGQDTLSGGGGSDTVEGGAGGASQPQRPEGLPDAYWDEKEGVKFGDLLGKFNDLDAFKASIDSKAAAVPEKPDAYELKLPADIEFSEGMSFDLNPDDPMVAFGREVAHKLGLDQSGFEGLVGMYAQREIAQSQEIEAAKTRQMEALGPKAEERVGSVKTFLSAKLGPNAVAIFEPVLMLKSGVETMEKLMRVAAGGTPGFNNSGRESGDPKQIEGWADMSPAEKFHAARSRGAGNGR